MADLSVYPNDSFVYVLLTSCQCYFLLSLGCERDFWCHLPMWKDSSIASWVWEPPVRFFSRPFQLQEVKIPKNQTLRKTNLLIKDSSIPIAGQPLYPRLYMVCRRFTSRTHLYDQKSAAWIHQLIPPPGTWRTSCSLTSGKHHLSLRIPHISRIDSTTLPYNPPISSSVSTWCLFHHGSAQRGLSVDWKKVPQDISDLFKHVLTTTYF